MVNTRAKFKKTQNIRKLCFTETSMVDSDHQSTESGALIGSNDDLLTEILRRLPVTSVLRFKSVSKHWRSLLSHRRFILMYDNNALASPGFFVRNLYIPFDDEHKSAPPFRNLDFYPDLCGIRIVQSCNGLLLCSSDRGNERDRRYYVFNPTTKQFAVVPSVPGGRDVRKNVRFMGLAFHQTDCEHYKVICIHREYEERFQIQIYSSDIKKWKISDQSFTSPHHIPFSTGVYWNGAIHWAPSCLSPLYFKLDVGELRTLPLPVSMASLEGYYDGGMPLYFGESGGHLHMVEKADGEKPLRLNVYEMLKDHSGWFVKYEVDLEELPEAYPEMTHKYLPPSNPFYHEFDVVDVIRGEKEEEETFMVIIIPGKVIKYNVVDKSFKHIFNLTMYGRIPRGNIHRYIQALGSF